MKRFLRVPTVFGSAQTFNFSAAAAATKTKNSRRVDPKVTMSSLKQYLADVPRVQKEAFELAPRVLKKDFNSEIEPVLKYMESEIGLSHDDIGRILHFKKDLLALTESDPKGIITSHQFLKDNLEITSEEAAELFVNYPVATTLKTQKVSQYFKYMREDLGFTQEQLKEAYLTYPRMVEADFDRAKQAVWTLSWMLSLTKEQVVDFLTKFPVVMGAYPLGIQSQIEFLKEECQFKNQHIWKLYNTCPHLLASDVSGLKVGVKFLRDNGARLPQLKAILLAAPEILRLRQGVLEKKKEFLLNNGVPQLEIENILQFHPEVFTRSYKSWQLKTKYLEQRLGIDITAEPTYPLSLNFNYNAVIRPRGELMLATENVKPLKDVLALTDEEFCEAIGCTPEELKKKISERSRTSELDFIWDMNSIYDDYIPDDDDDFDEE